MVTLAGYRTAAGPLRAPAAVVGSEKSFLGLGKGGVPSPPLPRPQPVRLGRHFGFRRCGRLRRASSKANTFGGSRPSMPGSLSSVQTVAQPGSLYAAPLTAHIPASDLHRVDWYQRARWHPARARRLQPRRHPGLSGKAAVEASDRTGVVSGV